jgi:phage replication initiation protein
MSLTKIDWYGFRTQSEIPAILGALGASFKESGGDVRLMPRKGGMRGAEQSADVFLSDMHIGLIAYGGESQKGWVGVNISGRGCEWLRDWEAAEDIYSTLPNYETRRIDIALDTFKGEVSHEKVFDAYHKGGFRLSGRPPKLLQILPGQNTEGRTIYIGDRTQAKCMRAYEKGYELMAGIKSRNGLDITHIDGAAVADIYRLELELKPKNVPHPIDLIEKRDQYFAGAYPYLQSVIDIEPEIFQTKKDRGPQRDLEAALSQVRRQYGNTLFTALFAFHGDVGAVWEKVVGSNHNVALLTKGVLMVEHEGIYAEAA